MSLPLDRDGDLARHVYDALEDEAAQPLRGLEDEAPEGFESFSELETSLSELSFGYGVAWALARMREPFSSSRRISELAAQATAAAWRSFSDESWRALMSADRAARGPAEARPEAQPEAHARPQPEARAEARPEAQPEAEPKTPPEAPPEAPPDAATEPGSRLDEFMGGLARARSRRPRDGDDDRT